MATDPKLHVVDPVTTEAAGIPKPGGFDLEKFRSKSTATVAGVEVLLTALPIGKLSEAEDYARLHPDEEKYWSPELCFVSVPVKGSKKDTLHLIDEALAMRHLEGARIARFRLALATKPFDSFFLCIVPTRNPDNTWNSSNMQACEQAKSLWVSATSRRDEGVDAYKIGYAKDQDAFPKPNWPAQSLVEIIGRTFEGRRIETDDHPGILRLIGAKQSLK